MQNLVRLRDIVLIIIIWSNNTDRVMCENSGIMGFLEILFAKFMIITACFNLAPPNLYIFNLTVNLALSEKQK